MMHADDKSKKRSTRPKRIFGTIKQIWPKTKLTGGTTLPNVIRMPASCKPRKPGYRLRQLITFRLPGGPLWTQTPPPTGRIGWKRRIDVGRQFERRARSRGDQAACGSTAHCTWLEERRQRPLVRLP